MRMLLVWHHRVAMIHHHFRSANKQSLGRVGTREKGRWIKVIRAFVDAAGLQSWTLWMGGTMNEPLMTCAGMAPAWPWCFD
jgi:hypothetical protein